MTNNCCCCTCPYWNCSPLHLAEISAGNRAPQNTPVFRPVISQNTPHFQPLSPAAYAEDRRSRTVIHIKAIETLQMNRKS